MSHDSKLQQDVLAEFKWEPSVTAAHIGVTANAGVVTLTGHVESYAEKLAAETAARRVVPRDSVQVKVEKGWITLSGQVKWQYQKEAAEQDVRRLFSVRGVSNQTTIKSKVDTSNISDDIKHALNRSWLEAEPVQVSAEGGRVKLTGTVHSMHDRLVAGDTAWAALGATHVENDIAVI